MNFKRVAGTTQKLRSAAGWAVMAAAVLIVLITVGCGTGTPDFDKVRSQLAVQQLDAGDPVANSVGMIFVPVPAGEFLRGTAAAKPADAKGQPEAQQPQKQRELPPGSEAEQPQHKVRISQPFLMSICEVTQSQYQQVMKETPWKGQPLTQEGDQIAATYVSWEQAKAFCQKLSELENFTYRLPTEAEWEYACRAGTTTDFSFGDDPGQLGEYAWYDQNAYKDGEQYAHAVGQKRPNQWSLYDMHGNVWEWCSDLHGSYADQVSSGKNDALTDPTGSTKGRQHVWRGGGFAENASNLRSACRNSFGRVDYRPEFMAGFRVVREMK